MKKLFIFLFVYFLSIGHAWAQTFTGPGGSVPGNSTAETCFSQVIAGVGTINSSYGLASVCINLTHTNDDDNEIFLVAPDGTKVPLSVNNGGAGDNYTNTCFSHTATASVKFGTAPFNGSYIPDGYLGMVNNGQNANGVWKLCVWDRRNPASGSGTLTNWSITFSNSPAPQPPAKPACSTTLVTGTSCSGAPMICSFSGVCGKTGGTDQQWPALASAACFGIENNSFVKFVASSSTVVFSVWVSSATTSLVSGIQAIFFSGTCSGTITSYGCYAHMRPNTLTQLTATGLTAGNTYYLMFDGYGGDVADFTIEAESGVNILDIDPGSASICEGESVDLTASGGNGIYAWTPATGLSATSGATVTATPGTGNNTYRVTSAGVGNCPIFKDVTVTVNAKPVITAQPATATQSVCQNGTVTALSLTANAGSGTIKSYQWYSNTTASTVGGTLLTGATAAGYTPSSAALGTLYYYCIITNSNDCTVTSNVSGAITITSPPAAPTVEVADECGKSTLTAKNYTGTLTWSDGGTGNPRTITTVSGPYTVTQTINGCTSEASNAVSANPSSISAPTLEVSDECGKSTLTAKNYTGTLTWSDGGTGNPRTITTVSGPYTVTQTASGCTSEASNAVSANPSSISSPTLEVADECGKSTLTAKNYTGTLTWSDGGTGNPRTITTVSGPYTVTQTMNGCTSEASNTVSANPSSISAPTLEVSDECGKSTLTAKNYTGTLTWSDAGTGNPRTITTASGPYTVTQSASGCISEASNAVSAAPSAIPQPPVLVVVNNCGNAVITATGYTGTLTWSDGGTGNPRTFTSAGGHYTVTQTIGACTSLLSNAVSTDPLPLPPAPVLTVSNSCSEATITATGYAGTLNWSDGGTGNPRIITTPGGPFTATQTIGTCTSRLSNGVMADFTGGGAANLLGNNTYLCPGETLLLDPGEYAAYVWQDNSVSRTYTVTRAGTYSVTVTDNQGCAFNDEIIVKGLVNCNEVYFPTAFSPNKDGKNDGFGVLGNLPGISAYSLSVYDRYGNVIFNTTDPYKKWDGTINGVQSNLNNYVWMAAYIYKGTEKRLQKGNIVLIR